MKLDRLMSMYTPGVAVSVDYETHRIQPGLLVPPLVCGSVATWDGQGFRGELLGKDDAVQAMIRVLEDPRLILCNVNIAFDLAVAAREAQLRGLDILPLIYKAYQDERIFDPGQAEALHAIAEGHLLKDPRTGGDLRDPITGEMKVGYRQSVLVDLVLGRADAKENARFRESYALLEPIPMEQWPADARQYPVDDTCNALEVALAQVGAVPNIGQHNFQVPQGTTDIVCTVCGIDLRGGDPGYCSNRVGRKNLHDLAAQCYAVWALHLGAVWGLRTDPVATEILAGAVLKERADGLQPFVDAGFIRGAGVKGKKEGTEDQGVVKKAVALAYGADPFGQCAPCGGTGKVPSDKTGGKTKVQCKECNATGLELANTSVPMTPPSDMWPKGQVQIGRDILIESGEEFLMSYGMYGEDDKIPDTYIPWLREGYELPLVLRPNNPLDTGRVSYSGVVQLLPRQVSAALALALKRECERLANGVMVLGVRDCIVPRPGNAFYSNDFGGGELVTHSENCVELIGYSRMGEALNAGLDVHSALGATMMGVDYESFYRKLKKEKDKRCKDFRQAAKPANFGFPGGMGAVKLVLQQRKQGPDTVCPNGPSMVWDGNEFVRGYKGLRFCILVDGAEACGIEKVTEWKKRGPYPPTCKHCIEVAERIRQTWFEQWPENREYLGQHGGGGPVNKAIDVDGFVVHLYSGRIRKATEFCSTANGRFQALLADIAKRAQCRVSYEQHVRTIVRSEVGAYWCPKPSAFEGQVSPLFGTSHSIGFFHDELFGEAVLSVAPEVSERVNEIMVEEFRKACRHHVAACKAEPTIMIRWWKAAEPVRDENGRLKCWYPKGWSA